MGDQLGQMSELMLQIVRSALEEEQAADAIETLNNAFVQGQLPSREIFFVVLAVVYGAPEFDVDGEAKAVLDRKIGRFEWIDLEQRTVISAMMLLKRWVATNPLLLTGYLFGSKVKISDVTEDGWLSRYSVDGGPGSDSDETEGAPLVPLLRLASNLQMCEDVWQMLSQPLPLWTATGGLSGSKSSRKTFAKLHEGDFDEDDESESEEAKEERQVVGVWRVLHVLTSLWTAEKDCADGVATSLATQLHLTSYDRRGRRQGRIQSGLESALSLIVTGLSYGYHWNTNGVDVVDPWDISTALLAQVARYCKSERQRETLTKRLADHFEHIDAASLTAMLELTSEDAMHAIVLGAVTHLDVSRKGWGSVADEADIKRQVDLLLAQNDLKPALKEILKIVRKGDWLRSPTDWATIEQTMLTDQVEHKNSKALVRAIEAIITSPAWTLDESKPIRAFRTKPLDVRGSHGVEVLVEATSLRLETVVWLTRRIEIQTFLCNLLPGIMPNVAEQGDLQASLVNLTKVCSNAVCEQGLRDANVLRTTLQRMRSNYKKLVNDGLSVKKSTKLRHTIYKKPRLGSSSSSVDDDDEEDDANDSVDEVHVPDSFVIHLTECRGLLTELSLLLDRTEANLETLKFTKDL